MDDTLVYMQHTIQKSPVERKETAILKEKKRPVALRSNLDLWNNKDRKQRSIDQIKNCSKLFKTQNNSMTYLKLLYGLMPPTHV